MTNNTETTMAAMKIEITDKAVEAEALFDEDGVLVGRGADGTRVNGVCDGHAWTLFVDAHGHAETAQFAGGQPAFMEFGCDYEAMVAIEIAIDDVVRAEVRQ